MTNTSTAISLYLMGFKGLKILEYMLENHKYLIKDVFLAKDSNVANDYYNELKSLCENNDLVFFDKNARAEHVAEYSIAVGWRWMIHEKNTKLIVLHDSLLPKYRGFNPLVSMLINGESEIGVTALFASDKYDEGDIIAISSQKIAYPLTIHDAINKITENYIELVRKICLLIENNQQIPVVKQNHKDSSYSLWRDEEDYLIDWSQDANKITRFIDAVGFPYKGAVSRVGTTAFRIIKAESIDDIRIENRTPGKVIFIEHGYPVVVCGIGLLKITSIVDGNGSSVIPFKIFRTRFH